VAEAPELDAEQRAARREAVTTLGAALRELVDAAVRTEVSIEELEAATEAAREIAGRLRAEQRGMQGIAAVDDPSVGERWYNPVYGPGSPVAPPMVVEDFPEGRCIGRVTVGKALEGPPGLVHGGVVATLLDHALARSARVAGRGGLTASLTVRFKRPVPLGVPLVITGELGETLDERRSTATARLTSADDPDTTLAEGEALLVALRPERAADVFGATGRNVGAWTARSPGD
jgi:acyl-coenzyme A thioesterase PaaI-like protein